MQTFQQWFKENFPDETIPTGIIGMDWFASHGIPAIVSCSCCQTTMIILSAMVDEDGGIFCPSCVGENDEYTEGDLGKNWY